MMRVTQPASDNAGTLMPVSCLQTPNTSNFPELPGMPHPQVFRIGGHLCLVSTPSQVHPWLYYSKESVSFCWEYNSRTKILNKGAVSPPREQLAIFRDILDCHNWGEGSGCYWQLVGTDQRWWETSYSAQNNPL